MTPKVSELNRRPSRCFACDSARAIAATILVVLGLGVCPISNAQMGAAIANVSQRPFVVAIIPVVGRNGAVGGVSIDASGAVARATPDASGKLRQARVAAAHAVGQDLRQRATIRCVSLNRLEQELAKCIVDRKTVPDEIRYLAGLQRVTHLFVYPDTHDIVLAGPAEGWVVANDGSVVGAASKRPVLHLDDFLVALRTAREALAGGLTCSIDPSADGIVRLQKAASSRSFRANPASIRRLEAALGPQQVTLKGVPSESRFARVMVAADFMMKRLAMGLEPSPIRQMPSYLELLQRDKGRPPQNMSPRWWMAMNYDKLSKDAAGLAWRLHGQGVKTLTETGYIEAKGAIADTGRADSVGQDWADSMTKHYDQLCDQMPVFADMRNCMDLAVIAAIISAHDLPGRAGWEMPLLFHPQLETTPHNAPQAVASTASLVRKGQSWIVAVSGGVNIDSWSILDQAVVEPALSAAREKSTPTPKGWWWDAIGA